MPTGAELYAQVDGQMVPITSCSWIFSHACGHPFGVLVARVAPTEEQAWKEFYAKARAREAARRRGVQCRLASLETLRGDDQFWAFMRDGCQCQPGVNQRTTGHQVPAGQTGRAEPC